MSDEPEGQRWAAAVESNYFRRDGHYVRRIVYCHTSQMSYATKRRHFNRCDLYGGKASWSRCSKCGDNWGEGAMFALTYPKALLVMCETKTMRFDLDDKRCGYCSQSAQCVSENVLKTKRVRLRVVP